jgi:Xaa-Pro aminopeptidase
VPECAGTALVLSGHIARLQSFDLGLDMRRLLALILLLAPASAVAQITADEYAGRRQRLMEAAGPGAIVAFGAPEPRHDYLEFDQGPRFRYLTGYIEPDAVLILVGGGQSVVSFLFVHPRDPGTEVWSGKRFGPDGATRATGMTGRLLEEFPTVLDSIAKAGRPLMLVSDAAGEGAENEDFQRLTNLLGSGIRVRDVSGIVDQLRGTKSIAELDLIRKAVTITEQAHREVLSLIEPGMREFEVEALIEYTFRRNGADRPAFASIVGSGPNSTTLHYNANDRLMQDGEVLVMDIGASYRGYAADVTRTVPVNGKFTPEQREIYQIVRAAQAAAEKELAVGADALRMNQAAVRELATGLARLGLIESPDATYDCEEGGEVGECPQYRLYYMHGLGHGIGLEVHDPEQYYFTRRIDRGSAFTIEPGIYVREHLLETLRDTPRNRRLASAIRDAVARYANIGVRIEDDYLVTDKGVEWISRAPREIEEIEAAMSKQYTGLAARKLDWVDWYRATEPPPALPDSSGVR